MSHEETAMRSVRESSRRRVKFQAVLEDLEGRVLLSTGVQRPRAAQAMVRMARMPKARMKNLRQIQLAALRRGQTFNIQPAINIQNTITSPTATASPTVTVPTVQTPATPQTLTPQGSTQSWPAAVTPTKPSGESTSSPTNQGQTTTPTTPSSSTPTGSNSTQPTTPTTPTSTTPPATTPSNPTPTTPTPAPPTFPDGTMLINAQTGEVAQYSSGARHLVSPPVAAKMGLNPAQLTAVADDQFGLIPSGEDYYPEGMFVRNDQTGEIARFSGGAFHWVSVPVATKLGLTGNDVATITADQYNKASMGVDYFPEGMLIQNVQTGEIDIYSDGRRHWISVPVWSKMNLTPAAATTLSASQFNRIPQGRDYFPDGAYLQNQVTGEIAQYNGGKLRVVSAPVAVVMGLTSAQWISVSPGQYDIIPKADYYYPEGIFIQNNQSGEISQYAGGQRHWVSSEAALALKITSAKIAAIGADQYNALSRGGDYQFPTTA